MVAAFDALLAEPILLLLVLATGAALGIAVERLVEGQRRAQRRAYWKGRNAKQKRPERPAAAPRVPAASPDLAADQLKAVMRATFQPRSLLNKSEARLFRELDRMVIDRNPDWQVMAQVCVGEFLSSEDADAFRCINSKRVDLLLMDDACQARHALEYQGTGHHQGSAAARDAVKKEALRKAGVGYHEVVAGHTTRSDLLRLVEKLVPLKV
ncbi:MAG: hypothetical protein B7Z08_12780 [Sphingomonadales bacterium 32-68-7]|nr:MAG: hypothetical protein B7Z33_00025 [Sphingomonadales bacterium 12-68-11]OYX07224.1 MAG: hypothetical protein B7Z08_12780 [Sphingomonadales bacterium 32-68-7]